MKKADYYDELLKDLKKEHRRGTHVIKALKDMRGQLQRQGYQPLDPLEGVIDDLKERQKYIGGYITRIEKMEK